MDVRQTFTKTLVVIGTVIGLYLLFQVRSMVLLFFGSVVFASTIRPFVLGLEGRSIQRPFSILLVFLATLLLLLVVSALMLPTLLTRFQELLQSQTQIVQAAEATLRQIQTFTLTQANITLQVPSAVEMQRRLTEFQASISARLRESLPDALRVASELIVLFVVSFYWLTERDRFMNLGLRMIPIGHRERFRQIWNELETTLGAYVRGQAIISFSVGLFSFVGLLLIGVPYAFLLAAFAALMELIPLIGPFIGAIPALLIALMTSPQHAILTAVLYALIQFVEAHILVPKITERAVGLSPLLVILAIAAGNILGGVLSALIAIPIAAAAQILVRHLIVEPVVEANKPTVTVDGAVLVGEAPVTIAPKTPSEVVLPPGIESPGQ